MQSKNNRMIEAIFRSWTTASAARKVHLIILQYMRFDCALSLIKWILCCIISSKKLQTKFKDRNLNHELPVLVTTSREKRPHILSTKFNCKHYHFKTKSKDLMCLFRVNAVKFPCIIACFRKHHELALNLWRLWAIHFNVAF